MTYFGQFGGARRQSESRAHAFHADVGPSVRRSSTAIKKAQINISSTSRLRPNESISPTTRKITKHRFSQSLSRRIDRLEKEI
jgi:hypothetical protein